MIDQLARELTAVGIRGSRRERILAEFADHLSCNPEADLGDPRELAVQFADGLASDAARRTAWATFGALAVVAIAVGVPQLTLPTMPDITGGRSPFLVGPGVLAMVLGSQIAFAAGSLAALRALRFGGPEDVGLTRRRVAVALGAGVLTVAGSALYAVNFSAALPRWWVVLAVAAAGAAALPLGLSTLAYARGGGLVVSQRQPTRGLSADLGPLARPALIGAAAALVMILATGALEASLVEGLIRGAFEAFAFACCYVALRRPLGLTG